jgi:hypothetical protein
MPISQAKAIDKLRKETGMSEAWCEKQARQLATVRDGKRWKVLERRLSALIQETLFPTTIEPPKGIRPTSPERLRRRAERAAN